MTKRKEFLSAEEIASIRRYSRTWYDRPGNRERAIAYKKTRSETTRERLSAIKVERGCVDCGYRDHPEALDFDHLPGEEKVYHVSDMLTMAWGRIEAEMAKCEVVCANCHRIRTFARQREVVA